MMKKVLVPVVVVIGILLTGCGGVAAPSPTPTTGQQLSTRISDLLTSMPTATVVAISPTVPLPTLVFTDTPTAAPTATSTPTLSPTTAAIATPTSSPAPTGAASSSATPQAGDPAASLGTPTWVDDMNNDTFWPTGANDFTDAEFKDGYMLLSALTTQYGWRMATHPSVTDFYFEMTAQPEACSYKESYGIIFRVPDIRNPNQGYLFGITCDGSAFLRLWDGTVSPNGLMTSLLPDTPSTAIQSGAGKTNRLGVLAKGDQISLYINGTLIKQIADSKFSSGYLGLFARADQNPPFAVRVNQVRLWENPGL